MDCAERLRVTVDQLDNINNSQVNIAAGTLKVFFTGENPDIGSINRAVRSTGHTLVTGPRMTSEHPVLGFFRFIFSQRNTTLSAIAGILTLAGLIIQFTQWRNGPIILFTLAIAMGVVPVVQSAWQEITRTRGLGINTLMVIAVAGATIIGEWAEAAIVVVLFAFGEALEGFAADRARGALDELLGLAPAVAHKMIADGQLVKVPVESLAIGDRVLVRPGDRVSVDGKVMAGHSAVDQSPITGESVPAEKYEGSEVFAGTINGEGSLEVKVSRLAQDNTLNRMVSMIQDAQSRQAPVQRFIDRFARVYTPAVAVAAFLVATLPPLILGQPFWGDEGWLMRALQMLVIACPCALVISTPVSVVSAMTNAAARGVLIKGGRFLDILARVKVIAFDKTGTLTLGKPIATDVIDVCSCGQCPENCGLAYAASLEAHSAHPLAQAILTEAQNRKLSLSPAEEVVVLRGEGLKGTVNGVPVTVANHAHFDRYYPHPTDVCTLAKELTGQGKSVMMVQHDNMVCSLLAVADQERPESRSIIDALESQHIHTVMLTGDNSSVAKMIGEKVGITDVRAALLPEQKMTAISELGTTYGTVAMVGDGINDSPALARAQVGIAMGGAGSHQAMETADVVLMGDDISQLPFIIKLSKKTGQTIRNNIIFALAIKAAVFILAATGLATLWMAILADVGASVLVILNGMRLRFASK